MDTESKEWIYQWKYVVFFVLQSSQSLQSS